SFSRDWSSDVCSSDLVDPCPEPFFQRVRRSIRPRISRMRLQRSRYLRQIRMEAIPACFTWRGSHLLERLVTPWKASGQELERKRSEERRVGKESESRW